MGYEFVVKQMRIKDIRKGTLVDEDKIFLCIENKVTGMLMPHPLSNFIKSTFDRKSLALKTQKNYAEEIKKFLNYTLDCISDEEEMFLNLRGTGISGLQLKHGASYITHLTQRVRAKEIIAQQVKDADRMLTKFYFWLSEQGFIKEKIQYREEVSSVKGKKTVTIRSPFDNFELGTEYPNTRDMGREYDRLHDFGDGRLDLVNLFIRIAELEAPDIALGIAFQFYGGLRKGEIVNLLRSGVKEPNKNGAGELTLNIKDNWSILFPDKKLTVLEQVKKTRIQAVFKAPIVIEMYKKHKDLISRMERSGKLKNGQALFCSIHTGRPISGTAYWERFTRVKNRFLSILLESDEEAYRKLTTKNWSTHIGRGIFTNMLVFLLGWSASEVMIARGDSNIQSSNRYIEEQNVKKKTEEAIEIIARATTHADKVYSKIEDLRGL
ncbi:hypothetical protein B4102_3331 [Heyndrickxia sporothermodurans]|uniref:Tyr recombinase domain-containing protein n=1 Tax=Heyndrickxia sporothermodurans TaxID=46224 RepID=A0A150KVJ1_9BACI|nr:hypothetical protein [Heyndrickxia sporothermodurans]KYD04111.1 hypothetical protein B4102_3331 [Heyndrickxia sporothermodurans]